MGSLAQTRLGRRVNDMAKRAQARRNRLSVPSAVVGTVDQDESLR